MLIHGFFSIFANKIGVNKFCLHPHLPVFIALREAAMLQSAFVMRG
ncbi:hypothetical protein MCETRH20_00393 [Methylophilaceae bacterium]